ncbi:MAG: DNA-directed RNA polymerase subunit alpha [Patescibacteria group bacterium]|jgi:DNA-directed RNA polymerase subunit alpha
MNKAQFHLETISETKTEGTYAVYPLPRGFGNTVGNMLRRILLSSLEGAAVTHVKIKGVSHPFTAVKGLKEDVMAFLLNIKRVRFAFTGDETQKLILKKKGKGIITAADIEDSTLCKVINTDLYLGELAEDGSIEVEIYVAKGVGYQPSEEKETSEYGMLPLDSVFSPVLNVSISVEGARVGSKTNFDKVILNVLTDGSVTGLAALKTASAIVVNYFNLIGAGGLPIEKKEVDTHQAQVTQKEQDDRENMMVDELDLPTRVINALIKHGVETVKQLTAMQDEDFAKVRGLGKKSVEELKVKLHELKLV